MNRVDVEQAIAKYTPEKLSLFADRFERWPIGKDAASIANSLLDREKLYLNMGCVLEAKECRETATEIINRAGDTVVTFVERV